MSAHGVLVVGDAVPAEGSKLAFKCNGVEIQGWVAWIRPPCAGIDFRDPIRTELLLRTCPVSNQLITKDTRTIDFKRPGFRGNQLTEEERRIVEEWSALTRMSSRAQ
jgi:hypothetical protein